MCTLVGVLCEIFVSRLFIKEVRWESSVGLATRYWLDGEEVEFALGEGGGGGIPHPSRRALEPSQLSVQWVTRLYRG